MDAVLLVGDARRGALGGGRSHVRREDHSAGRSEGLEEEAMEMKGQMIDSGIP
jgi:hypothetical protein